MENNNNQTISNKSNSNNHKNMQNDSVLKLRTKRKYYFQKKNQNDVKLNQNSKNLSIEDGINHLRAYKSDVEDVNIKKAINYASKYKFDHALKFLQPSSKSLISSNNQIDSNLISNIVVNTKKLKLSKKIAKLSKIYQKGNETKRIIKKNIYSNENSIEEIKNSPILYKNDIDLCNDKNEKLLNELKLFNFNFEKFQNKSKNESNKNLLKFISKKEINDDLPNKSKWLKIEEWDKDVNKNSQWSSHDPFKLKTYLPGNIPPHNFVYRSPKSELKNNKNYNFKNQLHNKPLNLKKSDLDFNFLKVNSKISMEEIQNQQESHFNLQTFSNSLNFINRHFESFDINLNIAKNKMDKILNPSISQYSQPKVKSLFNIGGNIGCHEQNRNFFQNDMSMYDHLEQDELISEIMRQLPDSNCTTDKNLTGNNSWLGNSEANQMQELHIQSPQRNISIQSNKNISLNNMIDDKISNVSKKSDESIKDFGNYVIKNIVKSKYK